MEENTSSSSLLLLLLLLAKYNQVRKKSKTLASVLRTPRGLGHSE